LAIMKHVSCTTKSSKSINVHNNFSSSHSFASLFSSSADHHAVSRVRSPSLYISQFNSMPLLLNLLFSSGELNRRQIHISRTSRPANQQLIPLGPIPARMRIDIVRNIIAILVLHTSRVGRNIEQMGRRRPRPGRLARSAPADADAAVALLHEGDVGLVVLWEGRVLLAPCGREGRDGEVCWRNKWGNASCTYLGVVERCETDAGREGEDGYRVVGTGWGLLAVSAAGGVVEAVLRFFYQLRGI